MLHGVPHWKATIHIYSHKYYAFTTACRKTKRAILALSVLWGLTCAYFLHSTLQNLLVCNCLIFLTPKGPRPFFRPFLKFGQAIVDAILVQKISNFWQTCGLVLASVRTNFYKIPISSLGAMPQKQYYFEVRTARASKNFLFKNFFGLDFFHKFLTNFLII
jgi:hypothetical protein